MPFKKGERRRRRWGGWLFAFGALGLAAAAFLWWASGSDEAPAPVADEEQGVVVAVPPPPAVSPLRPPPAGEGQRAESVEPATAPEQPPSEPATPGAPGEEPAAETLAGDELASQGQPPLPSEPELVGVRFSSTAEKARIVFDWPAPVAFTAREEGRDLVLSFARPFEAAGLAELSELLPAWIEDAVVEDDAVRLRAAREVSLTTFALDRRVVVDLALVAGVDRVGIRFSATEEGARVVFDWPAPVGFETEVRHRELVVRFARAFEAPSLPDLPAQLPDWVAEVSAEASALRLTAARDVVFETFSLDRRVVVDLKPSLPPAPVAEAEAPPPPAEEPVPALPLSRRVGVRAHATETGARIVLTWPEPVQFDQRVEGREILLRFDRALEAPGLADLPRRLPDWIEAVSVGDETILLRASREVDYRILGEGNEVVVELLPPPSPERERRGEAAGAPAVSREIVRAWLMADSGREFAARLVLRQLLEDHPDNLVVLLALAGLEERLGWRRQAAEVYERAAVLAPEDRSIAALEDRLVDGRGARIRAESDWQEVDGDDRQTISLVAVHIEPLARTDIGFVLEHRNLNDDAVRRVDGTVAPFDGDRFRGEVLIGVESKRARTLLSGFAATSTLGVGLEHLRRGASDEIELSLDYQRPFWGLVEGLVEGGTVDQIEANYRRIVGQRLDWTVGAVARRYGVEDEEDVATTLGFTLGVRLDLAVPGPFISVGYGVEGEYVRTRETRRDAAGAEFRPLPLVSREVHVVDVNVADELADDLRVNAFAGYGYDRLNADGPIAGLALTYEPLPTLEVGLRARHGKTFGRGEDKELNRAGGFAFWRF